MKRNFIILCIALTLPLVLFVTYFVVRQNRSLTIIDVGDRVQRLVESFNEGDHELNIELDQIYKDALSGKPLQGSLSGQRGFKHMQQILESIDRSVQPYGCLYCHQPQDASLQQIDDAVKEAMSKIRRLDGQGTELLRMTPVHADRFLDMRTTLRRDIQSINAVFSKMNDHVVAKSHEEVHTIVRMSWVLLAAAFLSLGLLITLLYRTVVKDIINLARIPRLAMSPSGLDVIRKLPFKHPEIQEVAALFIQAFEDMRRNEEEAAVQMEEIQAMNEELQSSNQQMEMIAAELENARATLEQRVSEKTAELERTYRELKELDDLKSAFLQSMSHEFKTPLTPLFGYLKLFKNRELGEINQIQEQSVDIMIACAEKLHNTIEDLILLARLDSEINAYPLHETDLVMLIRNVATRVTGELSDKKLVLDLDMPEMVVVIKADQMILHQTILHLIRNAMKHTTENGSITARVSIEDRRAVLRIADTGVGITPVNLREINSFLAAKPLFIGGKKDTINLGLNILKQVAAIHRADVVYRSERFKGTEVQITFPPMDAV